MIHRTPSAAHASHDELLLARLYGGDVDKRERETAMDLIAACSDCADFFADLGAIAAATAALAIPPRPRDFALTEADAARIRRRSIGSSLLGAMSRTGVLGRGMVAVGLVGVFLIGAVSAFLPAAGSLQGTSASVAGAPAANDVSPAYALGPVASEAAVGKSAASGGGPLDIAAATAAPPIPAPTEAAASTNAVTAVGPQAASQGVVAPSPYLPAYSAAPTAAAPATTSVPAVQTVIAAPGSGDLAEQHTSSGAAASGSDNGNERFSAATEAASGFDPRLVALMAFAGLVALGLLLLVAGRLAARRAGR